MCQFILVILLGAFISFHSTKRCTCYTEFFNFFNALFGYESILLIKNQQPYKKSKWRQMNGFCWGSHRTQSTGATWFRFSNASGLTNFGVDSIYYFILPAWRDRFVGCTELHGKCTRVGHQDWSWHDAGANFLYSGRVLWVFFSSFIVHEKRCDRVTNTIPGSHQTPPLLFILPYAWSR